MPLYHVLYDLQVAAEGQAGTFSNTSASGGGTDILGGKLAQNVTAATPQAAATGVVQNYGANAQNVHVWLVSNDNALTP